MTNEVFMIEPRETETWIPCDDMLMPELAERLRADAIRNGRTPSEELNYQLMVKMGLMRPSRTQ